MVNDYDSMFVYTLQSYYIFHISFRKMRNNHSNQRQGIKISNARKEQPISQTQIHR